MKHNGGGEKTNTKENFESSNLKSHTVEHFEIKRRKQQSYYPLWVCYCNMKDVRFSFNGKNKGPFGCFDMSASIYFIDVNCSIPQTNIFVVAAP